METKEEREKFAAMSADEKKFAPKPKREFFVCFVGRSYWHCEWVQELSMEVLHPTMLRAYFRKVDNEEPPKLDDDESSLRRRKKNDTEADPLEERYYKFGVRPDWLQIHRVVNHRVLRDGTTQYLVKWRELSYDRVSWEDEDDDIPNFKKFQEIYHVSYISE